MNDNDNRNLLDNNDNYINILDETRTIKNSLGRDFAINFCELNGNIIINKETKAFTKIFRTVLKLFDSNYILLKLNDNDCYNLNNLGLLKFVSSDNKKMSRYSYFPSKHSYILELVKLIKDSNVNIDLKINLIKKNTDNTQIIKKYHLVNNH
tara:strand:- start:10 stop:465 length:456 start_codon:yes stop_codon:yes gene_type:complete